MSQRVTKSVKTSIFAKVRSPHLNIDSFGVNTANNLYAKNVRISVGSASN